MSQEIVYNGKHLCKVICRGKHYVLEEAADPDTALAVQSTTRKHSRPSYEPKKSTLHSHGTDVGKSTSAIQRSGAIEHLQQASRNIVVKGKIESTSEVNYLSKAHENFSRSNF